MPSKRAIILERLDVSGAVGERKGFRVALWADVPVARRPFYANATATSAWKDASAAEKTALQNGSVVEKVEELSQPGADGAALQALLQSRWAAYQAEVNAYNPWARYGTVLETTNLFTPVNIA